MSFGFVVPSFSRLFFSKSVFSKSKKYFLYRFYWSHQKVNKNIIKFYNVFGFILSFFIYIFSKDTFCVFCSVFFFFSFFCWGFGILVFFFRIGRKICVPFWVYFKIIKLKFLNFYLKFFQMVLRLGIENLAF